MVNRMVCNLATSKENCSVTMTSMSLVLSKWNLTVNQLER